MTDNFRASLLMILTMAGFALEDLCIKVMSARLPMGEILLFLGVGGTLVMWLFARARKVRLMDPALLNGPILIRTFSEIFTQVFGFAALAALPLSVVTSIGQSGPIVTTLGAALFLGEAVGWRRWTAIAVGLFGVMLIIGPGSAAFHPAMIYSALAVVCVAARDLATRRAPASASLVQLNFWGYCTTFPAGLILMLWSGESAVMPSATEFAVLIFTLSLGVTFYGTLTLALRMGESSVVVPFRYTRLVFALTLAAIFLGERPGLTMLAGTALVTAAGLYTLLREARLRRRVKPSPDPVAPL